ncbi:unnamed protein product, partial [Acanthocheilonema viteae]
MAALREEFEKYEDEAERTSYECMTLTEEMLLELYTTFDKMEAQCDQFEAMIEKMHATWLKMSEILTEMKEVLKKYKFFQYISSQSTPYSRPICVAAQFCVSRALRVMLPSLSK